jgi:hypothetical protein
LDIDILGLDAPSRVPVRKSHSCLVIVGWSIRKDCVNRHDVESTNRELSDSGSNACRVMTIDIAPPKENGGPLKQYLRFFFLASLLSSFPDQECSLFFLASKASRKLVVISSDSTFGIGK